MLSFCQALLHSSFINFLGLMSNESLENVEKFTDWQVKKSGCIKTVSDYIYHQLTQVKQTSVCI